MWETKSGVAVININGEKIEIDEGESFISTIKQVAEDSGYSKFRVFLVEDGIEAEVDPSDAPVVFEADMEVFIKPYEKAA